MNIYKYLTLLSALIFAALIYLVAKVDFYDGIPKYNDNTDSSFDHIIKFTNNASSSEVIEVFSFNKYIKSRGRVNIRTLQSDIQTLDSLYPDFKFENKKLLSIALTDSLNTQEQQIFNNYSPDELIMLMQWVEQFKYYANIDAENELLYLSIHGYWVNKMANYLSSISQNEPSLKYDFKFRFLRARFSEQGYDFGPKVTSIEKVLYNTIDSNWAHLFDASWNQASKAQKILFFIIFLMTSYAYFLLLEKIYNKIKNK